MISVFLFLILFACGGAKEQERQKAIIEYKMGLSASNSPLYAASKEGLLDAHKIAEAEIDKDKGIIWYPEKTKFFPKIWGESEKEKGLTTPKDRVEEPLITKEKIILLKNRERSKKKVVVLSPTESKKILYEENMAIYEAILAELNDYNGFEVLSYSDIMEMLRAEEKKQALNCDDISCFQEIGNALGADLISTIALATVGNRFVISIKLIDMHQAKVLSRVSISTKGGLEAALDRIPSIVYSLIEKSGTQDSE